MKKRILFTAILISLSMPAVYAGTPQELKSENITRLYENAEKYFENDKFSETIKLCDRAISLDPQNEKLYILKILALYSADKINERNKMVEKSLKLFPNSSVLTFYQGCVYYENKDFEKAIKYLEKSIELLPSSEAYHVMGLCYGELKQHKKAVECFNEEVKLTPVMKNREILSQAEKLLDEKEYKKAYELADNVSKTEPSYYLSFKIKALALMNMSNYPAALKFIDKAIERSDDNCIITLYAIRDNILFNLAYLNGNVDLKYAQEFEKDFADISAKNYYQLESNDIVYEPFEYNLMTYMDYLVTQILKSDSYALYKINTLLSMMSSDILKNRKYSNMYYYKLYAIALKIALTVSDFDLKQTKTSRKKVLSMIRQKTYQEGDRYQDDFSQYLEYRLSEDDKKSDTLIKYMVTKRDKMHAYPNGALYEDDIDEIMDYLNEFEDLIYNYHEN